MRAVPNRAGQPEQLCLTNALIVCQPMGTLPCDGPLENNPLDVSSQMQAMAFNYPHSSRVPTVPGEALTAFATSRKLTPLFAVSNSAIVQILVPRIVDSPPTVVLSHSYR